MKRENKAWGKNEEEPAPRGENKCPGADRKGVKFGLSKNPKKRGKGTFNSNKK